MTDKTTDDLADDRQDRMAERFTEGDEHDQSTESDESDAVRDITGRTFFLGEERLQMIDSRYAQLNAAYFEQYGTELAKNKTYYPALFNNIDWEGVEQEVLGEDK